MPGSEVLSIASVVRVKDEGTRMAMLVIFDFQEFPVAYVNSIDPEFFKCASEQVICS